MSDFAGLSINGRLATPGEGDWDQARAAFNLAADQQPAAVAFVESAEDVAQVVRFAGARGLRIAAQGTGHGAITLGGLEDTIVIKTERMRAIEVDAESRSARVEAGVLALALGSAAQGAGLCAMPGSSPDVGIVGFTLGGGLGWLGRGHGFACNRVTAIELVSAEGELLRADPEDHSELFWALRGGGGGYAIVTALHLSLLPISDAYAGTLILPAELGADAIRAYRDWAYEVPEEVTSIIRFLRPPPLPDVPEPLRDRPLLTIGAASIGTQGEGEKIIAPLREIGEPIMDTFAQIPAEGLSRIHMDPEQPVPALGHHALVRELSDEAIDAFVAAAGPEAGSTLLLAELRQLGGELGRAPDGAGALASLDADFLMFGTGVPMSPEAVQAIDADLDRLHAAIEPWAAAGGFLNFAERPGGLDTIVAPDTYTRLSDVKRQWDPDGLIRANHEL